MEKITPKEIIEFIDSKLIGNVVPLDVERDAIQMIEEYAKPSDVKTVGELKTAEELHREIYCGDVPSNYSYNEMIVFAETHAQQFKGQAVTDIDKIKKDYYLKFREGYFQNDTDLIDVDNTWNYFESKLSQSSSKSEGSEAVEFANWIRFEINKDRLRHYDPTKNGKWAYWPKGGGGIAKQLTTQELYSLFKDEQQLRKK
nr:hypothetical protein [uncultured Flavobacterium sp.]